MGMCRSEQRDHPRARLRELATCVLNVLLVLLLVRGHATAVRQDVSSEDHRESEMIATPCQNLLLSTALREALRLVCSREPVEAQSRRVRKAIILGFVGGFARRDDMKHPEVLFATYLQNRYGSAVHVEVFGNHEGKVAIKDTIRRLDKNNDGLLTDAEKTQTRIILYGHSWGASQVLAIARELQLREIPVALTVQIDSVKKLGQDDRRVPTNVATAVNFYQSRGVTPGQPHIVPADATRTIIVGNFHMRYKHHQIKCDNYRWMSRVFNGPHHQIENDPQIWDRVTSLIDSELLRTDSEIQLVSPLESALK